jgi:dipeptidyl aminopeptidase/acylaminoacyl peptidase
MKKQVGILVYLAALLSACGVPAVTTAPATQMPLTSTPSPVLTFTSSQEPTLSPQIRETATQQALQEKLEPYCASGRAMAFQFSPDGEWVEIVCSYDTLAIVHVDEGTKWDISSDTLINPFTEYFVSISHWSSDGLYAYTSPDPHTDGYWEPFHQGVALFRLNLETGEISEILPLGKDDWIFYSYAFSPDDNTLVYIVTDKSPITLNVRDLQTGAEQSFHFAAKYNTGGAFVWSPGGEKLVFSVTQYDTSTAQYIATSIVLWDRQKAEITELIKDHPSRMDAVEWRDEAKVILQAEIYESEGGVSRKYEFDLTTQTLTEVDS